MANQFYVEPAAPMAGITNLMNGIQSRAELETAKAQEAAKMEKRQEAVGLMQTGTPEEIAAFTLENPWIREDMDQAIGFVDDQTKQNAIESAKQMLIEGADPAQTLINRAEMVIAQGGDASGTMQLAEQAFQDPQAAVSEAEKVLALYDPEALKQYRALTAPAEAAEPTDVQIQYEQAKREGYAGSLLDYQLTLSGRAKTDAIKEFEYAERNPKFAVKQQKESDAAAAKEAKTKVYGDAKALRSEYLSQSSEYQQVRDSYSRIIGSTQDPSPAGDLSLIFNYMKMLDPGSVVRESEFQTAATAGSYGERIKAAVQKVASGERLSPDMRADFLSKASTLFQGMENQHNKRSETYRSIAEKNNLPVDEVVVDIGMADNKAGTGTDDVLSKIDAGTATKEETLRYIREGQ